MSCPFFVVDCVLMILTEMSSFEVLMSSNGFVINSSIDGSIQMKFGAQLQSLCTKADESRCVMVHRMK